MTPAARLQATLILAEEIDTVARPADAVISGFFRGKKAFDDEDRGAILDLVSDLLRHQARLDWWLAKHGRKTTPRNRLLAWLTVGARKPADQIKRLFNGGKFAPEALTDQEYTLLIKLKGSTIQHPAMAENVQVECPEWAAGPLRDRFGADFGTEMAALLTPPALDVRVNTVKTTPKEVLHELTALGLEADPLPRAANGIRISQRMALSRLPALKRGEIEIQDEGSQLVAMLVDAQPGERVVDFCAGAGGKTLAIATQMNNKGHIVACDVNEGRLKRCAERMRKAGLHNGETRLLASETDRWVKRRKGGYDRVLVDAPCSGTGTWRRNPDARWRAPEEKGLEALVALQARILASAARLVKPGGRLVYATCSLLTEENEAQVAGFLAANPAFRVVPLSEVAPQITDSAHPEYLSLTPARHDTDGFFAAVLRRDDGVVTAETPA